MERTTDGAIILTPDEVRTVRAALFGLERFTQRDIDADELRYVTGHSREQMQELLVHLDAVREPERVQDERRALRLHLEQLDAMTDTELAAGRTRMRLEGVVREALAAEVEVPSRLLALAGNGLDSSSGSL